MREATGGGVVCERDGIHDLEIEAAVEALEVWRAWSRVGRPGPKAVRGICLAGASDRMEMSAQDDQLASRVDMAVASMEGEAAFIIKARWLWGWTDVSIAQKIKCHRNTVIARRHAALRVLVKKLALPKAA